MKPIFGVLALLAISFASATSTQAQDPLALVERWA